MENFIVTFARGFGTGGKEIASMLAKDLGIHCYENRILTLASQMSGLDEKLFLDINERIRNNGGFTGFLKGLPRSRQYIARNEKFVSDDRLFEYQSQIIRNLADQESCVIVGKCADYVLKGRKNVVSIYIEAPRAFCLERTMQRMKVSADVAAATRGAGRDHLYRWFLRFRKIHSASLYQQAGNPDQRKDPLSWKRDRSSPEGDQ